LVQQSGLGIQSITGTDEEVEQSGTTETKPSPVEMPFEVTFAGALGSTSKFFKTIQQSIRPIKVQSVTITGSDAKISTTVSAVTYYQPEKNLNIREEIVE
jgi:hypothetical protein